MVTRLTIVGPLGEKLDFFSPLRFEPESEFGHETSKLNPHLIRAKPEQQESDTWSKTPSIFLFSSENLNLASRSFTRLLISLPGGN